MSEQGLPSSIEAALAHVDPDRRKFLRLLLAGIAAAPLLTSASLAAQEKPGDQTVHQVSPAIKNGSATTIKMNDQKAPTVKFWDQTGNNATSTSLKDAQTRGVNPALKPDSSTTKVESPAIRGVSPALKLDASTNKGANANTIKGQTSSIKGATTPTAQ
jgi:hypothetical protein